MIEEKTLQMKKIKIDKRKLYKRNEKYINDDNIKIAILFLPLLFLFFKKLWGRELDLNEFLDVSLLTSFLFVFLCDSIAKVISNIIYQKTEDAMKLNDNYNLLVSKYALEREHMVCADGTKEKIYIPAIVLCKRKINQDKPFEIEIIPDEKKGEIKRYSLPKQIAEKSDVLFRAHEHSVIYNNLNIRLNHFEQCGQTLKLSYCFTTYFDSLITNRAMDYPFRNGHTIREIYEPGPLISSLQQSKLSNHLGFNGFVELKDGNIIFVYRSNKVSVAKNTWAQSIGASLKTKYCLKGGKLTKEGLNEAMMQEIKDELKIPVQSDEDFTRTIISFYRDLVEGGKPQFLFYYKFNEWDKYEFEDNFRTIMAGTNAQKENKEKLIVDGQKFAYFTLDELKKCKFTMNEMITADGGKYSMVPSSIASIELLLESWT